VPCKIVVTNIGYLRGGGEYIEYNANILEEGRCFFLFANLTGCDLPKSMEDSP
jgi:hypothetical protein